MKKFQVITDSTCDLSIDEREKDDIDILNMSFILDSKEYQASLEWKGISAEKFYSALRNSERLITQPVSEKEFTNKFETYLKQGLDILYIACSSKLSGSLKIGRIVAASLSDKYPNNKIVCFDSLRSTCSQGMIAIKASKMANDGKNIEDCVDLLMSTRLCYQTFASVGSIDYLKRVGKVKTTPAFVTSLLGLKPIIVSDAFGANYAYDHVRGKNAIIESLTNIVLNRIDNNSTLYIQHSDSLSLANELKASITSQRKIKDVKIRELGPITGGSVGPDSISVSFFGDKIDFFNS